jgi:coenzyme F420-0:L-glutamate ligase/coenzyme F420-1:gamma-L-glutamate ligase
MPEFTSKLFWEYFDRLIEEHPLQIDRRSGTPHPRYPEMIYPLDYGFLKDTRSADGQGIDVWVGSRPKRSLDGLALTVDVQKGDAEIKLLLGCTPEEKNLAVEFMCSGGMQAMLLERSAGLEFLKSRRSMRRFLPNPLPADMLDRILEVAIQAPSAHNRQPWRFVVLESPASRTRLTEAMGEPFRKDLLADGYTEETVDIQVERSRQRIHQAPSAVLICMDTSTLDIHPDASRQRAAYLMMVQSTAMAGENLLLAAHALGLGAVWMCSPLFAQPSVQKALELPAKWEPQGLVLLGHPAKKPVERERTPASELTMVID